VSPVRYEQGSCIPEDGIFFFGRENLKSYMRIHIPLSILKEESSNILMM
jgi:hypothetical protein